MPDDAVGGNHGVPAQKTRPEPQMKCPHCERGIAVRLDKPGKKAARRRTLRARKAEKIRALRDDSEPQGEEE